MVIVYSVYTTQIRGISLDCILIQYISIMVKKVSYVLNPHSNKHYSLGLWSVSYSLRLRNTDLRAQYIILNIFYEMTL